MFFGPDGKPISSLEYHLALDNKKEQEKKEEESDDELKILEEADALKNSHKLRTEAEFMTKVKDTIEKHRVADSKEARKKLTEMRLKKKRKLRKLRGYDDDGDDDGVQLASQNGSEGEQSDQEMSE